MEFYAAERKKELIPFVIQTFLKSSAEVGRITLLLKVSTS